MPRQRGNYGLTKKMMAVQAQAYKKQYGLDSIHLILTNLYGPGDSYNPDRSHVVAALVRKLVEAERARRPSVEVWGTGKPIREFLYVEDCADAIVAGGREVRRRSMPLNIGTGIGTSIRSWPRRSRDLTAYRGKMVWDDRQAGRPGDEDPGPDAARGPADVAADARAARRPGQDHRLVRRAQGRGRRAMVTVDA